MDEYDNDEIEREDEMARELDQKRRRALEERYGGERSCAAGSMYVHTPGVTCLACGKTP